MKYYTTLNEKEPAALTDHMLWEKYVDFIPKTGNTKIIKETGGIIAVIEGELHYSGGYINKITKKYTGLSIHDFGMTICMEQAARELVHSAKSISDIAAELGFSNRTHFYRQFEKVYHTLPGEFQKEFSQNLPEV